MKHFLFFSGWVAMQDIIKQLNYFECIHLGSKIDGYSVSKNRHTLSPPQDTVFTNNHIPNFRLAC